MNVNNHITSPNGFHIARNDNYTAQNKESTNILSTLTYKYEKQVTVYDIWFLFPNR